jgi:protein-disulfide isomerase
VPKPGRRSPQLPRRTLLLVLAGAAVVVAALVIGSLLLGGGDDEASTPTTPSGGAALIDGISQEGVVLGDPGAKVKLVVYEDLQCPVCKRWSDDVFPSIVEEYVRPGQVRLDFRGLEFLGEDSNEALRAVLAAARQDKAWPLIKLLYDRQGAENSGWVTEDLLRELGGQVDGLDVDKMLADAQTGEISDEIARLEAEAQSRGVPGTPAFLVEVTGGQTYPVAPNALTPDAFRAILDDALAG